MGGVIWLSNVENSEPVGIPVQRITLIEQKPGTEGNVVAIHLDNGKELRVIEALTTVKTMIEDCTRNTCSPT